MGGDQPKPTAKDIGFILPPQPEFKLIGGKRIWQVIPSPPSEDKRRLANTPAWIWHEIAYSLTNLPLQLPNNNESQYYDWAYLDPQEKVNLSRPFGNVVLRRLENGDLDVLLQMNLPEGQLDDYIDLVRESNLLLIGVNPSNKNYQENFKLHSGVVEPSGHARKSVGDDTHQRNIDQITLGNLISSKEAFENGYTYLPEPELSNLLKWHLEIKT